MTRTLPIPAEQREFTVKSGGETVSRIHHLLSVSVHQVANRIGSARLAYLDGVAASSDFPLSNTELFKPGQTVEILAGSVNQNTSIFKGIVVRHSLRVRDHSAPQLIVECRHAATKLSLTRHDRSYFNRSDSQIIEEILGEYSIEGEVEATSVTHKQMVQFHRSDWDFLLDRAAANGKLVWPNEDTLVIKAPATEGDAVITLQFGATLIELDAQIDARLQYNGVRGTSWDPAQQATFEIDAATPSISGPGNLSADELAMTTGTLRHAALSETETQDWADATWSRAHLNKVSGRAKCEGIATVRPGDIVALAGVGARFNGKVFVTGVRHEYDLVQGWKTHLQFGGIDAHDSAPAAGGLLARVAGLQIGVVTSLEDPDGEHRVRIRLPMLDTDDGIWARIASLAAGNNRGFFFRPEIADEVIVGFLDDDPRCAVILGNLHSSANAAPLMASNSNDEKMFKSRAGLRLYFNDEQKIVQIDTPAGNRITLNETEKSIVLSDQNSNAITLDTDGISIESARAIKIKAGSEIAIESATSLSAKGGTDLKLEGGTQAELTSSAITSVKGSMVQIN